MKQLTKALALILAVLMLTGCSPDPQPEPTQPSSIAAPETTAPTTEPPAEPPTEPPTERELSAFEIFFKSKAAAPDYASGYATCQTVTIRTGANGLSHSVDITTDTLVSLSEEPFGIDVQTELHTVAPGITVDQTVREYYRLEETVPVLYADFEQLGYSVRTLLPDNLYPDIDPEEYPDVELPSTTEWLLNNYYESGYPPEAYAQYIELEPQTQIIDGREAYVLRYEQSALGLFGFTEDAGIDADLASIRIPTYWYVDKETYMPIKREYSMSDLDPLTTAAMVRLLNIQLPEDMTGLELEIVQYTYTLKDIHFDPAPLPDVPQEVVDRALSDLSAT